jgi:hypothetical protein
LQAATGWLCRQEEEMAAAAAKAGGGADELAVPFIVFNNDIKQFEVGAEAIAFLAGIDEQIGESCKPLPQRCDSLQLLGHAASGFPPPCAASFMMVTMCAATVIIAGRYRSGKSLLMGQLTGRPGEFSVGHTVQGHTQVSCGKGVVLQRRNRLDVATSGGWHRLRCTSVAAFRLDRASCRESG